MEDLAMISTDTLMLGKATLTFGVLLGFFVWQFASMQRLKKRREDARRAEAEKAEKSAPGS
jgi:hypothetical protein